MKTFRFQDKRKKNYFEGWYTRFQTEQKINFAVIFAVTKNVDDPHSFIQVFNEKDKACEYLRFQLEDFRYDVNTETVYIKNNSLSLHSLLLNTEEISIQSKIENQLYLSKLKGPNSAMGILEKAPLDCFQEVVFLNGDAEGKITYKGKNYEITGNTYMEKTYGNKFPKEWVWIQSNHSNKKANFSFSVGKVPVLFTTINGFLALLEFNNKLYYFSTSNRSKITITQHEDDVKIRIKKKNLTLVIEPKSNNKVTLVGPKDYGEMSLDVFESINSTCEVRLLDNGKVIFKSTFTDVGYEQMYFK